MISNDAIWFSPLAAISEYLKLLEEVGVENVQNDSRYSRALETRAVAMLCLVLFKTQGALWFLQLVRDDPPDALIMRQSPLKRGQQDLFGIEVTTYGRGKAGTPKESVFEQLKKTKIFQSFHKYSENDAILVDVAGNHQPDYGKVQNYLEDISAPYQVWFIQEVQSKSDTIVRFASCNKNELSIFSVNVGQAGQDMLKLGIDYRLRAKRVGNISAAGGKPGVVIEGAPWDIMK